MEGAFVLKHDTVFQVCARHKNSMNHGIPVLGFSENLPASSTVCGAWRRKDNSVETRAQPLQGGR